MKSLNAMCGLPVDMRERITDYDGKQCIECFKLKDKMKKCLKCGEDFQPGCRVRFHCFECHVNNSNKLDF